jgi:hypothetical protein
MNQKPEWLIYAAEVRQSIDKMRPTKSGKRERDAIRDYYLIARDEKGYEGSLGDWEILLRRVNEIR